MKRVFFVFFILTLFPFMIYAQEIDMTDVEVEPYDTVQFPPFLLEMRRSEIITLGSYPFTSMAVGVGYSFFKYFSNGMDPKYRPISFMKTSSANFTDEETRGIILGAAGLSLGIGIIDFFLNQIIISKERQEKAERFGENGLDPDITIIPVYKDKKENFTVFESEETE